jgi:hypothetical protein
MTTSTTRPRLPARCCRSGAGTSAANSPTHQRHAADKSGNGIAKELLISSAFRIAV